MKELQGKPQNQLMQLDQNVAQNKQQKKDDGK